MGGLVTNAKQVRKAIALCCSGMGASAIGLSHVAIQFPVYEFFKRWLAEKRQRERGEAVVADRLSTVDLIIASGTSKVLAYSETNECCCIAMLFYCCSKLRLS